MTNQSDIFGTITKIGIIIPHRTVPDYIPDRTCADVYKESGAEELVQFSVLELENSSLDHLLEWQADVDGLVLTGSWKNVVDLIYHEDPAFSKLLTFLVYLLERDRLTANHQPLFGICFGCQTLSLALLLHQQILGHLQRLDTSNMDIAEHQAEIERILLSGLLAPSNLVSINPVGGQIGGEHGIYHVEIDGLPKIQDHWAFNYIKLGAPLTVLHAHACWIDLERLAHLTRNVVNGSRIGPDGRRKVDIITVRWPGNEVGTSGVLGTQFHCDLPARILFRWFYQYEGKFIEEAGCKPSESPFVAEMRDYFGMPNSGSLIFRSFVETARRRRMFRYRSSLL